MQAGYASWLVNNQSEKASNSLWHFVILSSWHQLCLFQPNILRIYGNQSTKKVDTGLVNSFLCFLNIWFKCTVYSIYAVYSIQCDCIFWNDFFFFYSAFYITSLTCISSVVAKFISEKNPQKILYDLVPQSNVLKLEFIVYFWGP